MKIKRNEGSSQVRCIPEPQIKGVGVGDDQGFFLTDETVMQLAGAAPAFFIEETMKRLHNIEVRLGKGDSIARDELNKLVEGLRSMKDELAEMPSGRRNSQDIERLRKKVDGLMNEGGPVTEHAYKELKKVIQTLENRMDTVMSGGMIPWMQGVDKKLSDLDLVSRTVSKAVDEYNNLRSEEAADTKRRVTELETMVKNLFLSNEQRKKDLKHAWNRCDELDKSNEILRTNFANLHKEFQGLTMKCNDGNCDRARQSVCFKKLDDLSECCKNTVAAGKEVEKRVDYCEASLKNHCLRLDGHHTRLLYGRDKIEALEKASARAQKFMDKLHEL